MSIDNIIELSPEQLRLLIKYNKAKAKNSPNVKHSALRCRNHLCQKHTIKRNTSKNLDDGSIIVRHYRCVSCGYTFYTEEKLKLKIAPITIINEKGVGNAFEFDKFYESIKICCDTVFSSDRAMRIAEGIHETMQNQNKSGGLRIPSSWLADRVLESLKDNSWVAFTRYASLHKKFASQEAFVRYISK